jgi:hypothetical protein
MSSSPRYYSPSEAVTEFLKRLNDATARELRGLLQAKHIYQKVSVDPNDLVEEVKRAVVASELMAFETRLRRILNGTRFAPSLHGPLHMAERDGSESLIPTLLVQNVKLYCAKCESPEAFAPIWCTEITNDLNNPRRVDAKFKHSIDDSFQLFVLTFQCQHCQGEPESFLVRRKDWNLILEGRSPMEHVDVPAFVPRKERNFFRDALVAAHGGKILAALFYLRTFIEQFARRQTGTRDRISGDEIMAAYSQTLPERQRDEMPSLREWYGKLSDALHTAREDAQLFEDARAEIEKHFDIRRVFKIPELNK